MFISLNPQILGCWFLNVLVLIRGFLLYARTSGFDILWSLVSIGIELTPTTATTDFKQIYNSYM